jgi:AraC family transcriptional regulator
VSVTARALWHIESHLDSDLSLEAIAEASGVSRFHLSRAFGASTGQSLAGYVRGRRLGQAARALAGGASDIMSLALEAGYGSHEAFTRAFRQQFGMSPEQLRSQANTENMVINYLTHTDSRAKMDSWPKNFPVDCLKRLSSSLILRYA